MARKTPSSARAQQHATRAAFFVPGFAIATWAPLIPFAKTRVGLDEAALGLVLLCLGAGALLSMPLAGAMAARRGCRTVLAAAQLLLCATLPLLTLAGPPWLLGTVLLLFGAGIGALDSTMNVQAVMVERDSGRAMMSGFHAWYSIGGLAGAAGMTALLAAGVKPLTAGVCVSALILAMLGLSCRHFRTDRLARDAPALAWPRGAVMLLGVLCFIMFMAEGSMLDWSAVFLHEMRGVEAARAGQGFVVFSLTMTLARLLGDAWVQRLGRTRTVVVGGLCACTGLLAASLVPAWQAALAGYALAGLGCANIVPVLYSLAGQQKSMPESLAVPAITTLGYAGVLAGPALIGLLASATSLATAFVGVAAALLAVVVAMRWLRSA